MDAIREQIEIADEITQAISSPLGAPMDDEELKNELAELEQEQLNERLMGAEPVPVHSPTVAAGRVSTEGMCGDSYTPPWRANHFAYLH
jgi:charged multivesicular body protein 4